MPFVNRISHLRKTRLQIQKQWTVLMINIRCIFHNSKHECLILNSVVLILLFQLVARKLCLICISPFSLGYSRTIFGNACFYSAIYMLDTYSIFHISNRIYHQLKSEYWLFHWSCCFLVQIEEDMGRETEMITLGLLVQFYLIEPIY